MKVERPFVYFLRSKEEFDTIQDAQAALERCQKRSPKGFGPYKVGYGPNPMFRDPMFRGEPKPRGSWIYRVIDLLMK